MIPRILAFLVAIGAFLGLAVGPPMAHAQEFRPDAGANHEVLILVDAPNSSVEGGSWSHVYALQLRNLLGRYPDLHVVTRPASTYAQGEAGRFVRTFYVGGRYDAVVPEALAEDVLDGAAVTWLHYGIWALDRAEAGAGLDRLGLSYVGLHAATEPAAIEETFRTVEYRGHEFRKHPAPMEVNEVQVAERVEVHAWAVDASGRRIPYALRSGRFWYVADMPFAYVHETDRYLVFADLLGPMLGRDERCEPRAVVRIEDVSPNDPPENLRRAIDLLAALDVPFAAAVIPRWASNAAEREGRPDATIEWSERPEALAQLRRVPRMGGRVFQHGTTHQVPGYDNPSGTSGDDWEFWDANAWRPLDGMDARSAVARVREGRRTLEELGFDVAGWVTPHYAFDPAVGSALAEVHPIAFERRQYGSGDHVTGQFFPYPVVDAYGARIVPENAGSIQPDHGLPEIVAAARAHRVLRCPWFGFFFHPYVLAPSYDGPNAVDADDLARAIGRVRAMGFRFVDPATATDLLAR